MSYWGGCGLLRCVRCVWYLFFLILRRVGFKNNAARRCNAAKSVEPGSSVAQHQPLLNDRIFIFELKNSEFVLTEMTGMSGHLPS
jgi:hypothetical protein